MNIRAICHPRRAWKLYRTIVWHRYLVRKHPEDKFYRDVLEKDEAKLCAFGKLVVYLLDRHTNGKEAKWSAKAAIKK